MSSTNSPTAPYSGAWQSPNLSNLSSAEFSHHDGRRSRGPSPIEKSASHKDVTWEAARSKSARVKGYREDGGGGGFLSRHMRRLSIGLPYFTHGGQEDRYAEKEKVWRGRYASLSLAGLLVEGQDGKKEVDWQEVRRRVRSNLTRRMILAVGLAVCVILFLIFGRGPLRQWYRRSASLGGGSKFVIILAANEGGGVMDWKGSREWAIERDSVRNKKRYAERWGYHLEIADMVTKKKYSHEWRESWEKVDLIKTTMAKYPDAEWFWWLDLNTYIVEPSYSLQAHIFDHLGENTYRDININNPLKIVHPPNITDPLDPSYPNYMDGTTLSAVGDGLASSISLVVPQDCSGFNLGSFFVRRSAAAERILDAWWDPVFYEQRHMQWEHKEQDALEYIYTTQPWIRSHLAFIPQRRINAFPHGACGDDKGIPAGGCTKALQQHQTKAGQAAAALTDAERKARDALLLECGVSGIHYQEKERDFLVNMAGCEWGRDCWGEIYYFRELSNWLNRTWWEKFKDRVDGKERRHNAERARQDAEKKKFEQEEKERAAAAAKEKERAAAAAAVAARGKAQVVT